MNNTIEKGKHTPEESDTYVSGLAAPHIRRKAVRDYLERNRDKINAQKRARYRKQRETELERFAIRRNTPEYKAGALIRRLVFEKRIIKPDRCFECGKLGKVQGHHRDYTKPLEVMWLCSYCHGKRHRKRDALIAAAPELLELLKDALPFMQCDCGDSSFCTCHVAKSRAVIAKAEGKE